MSIFPKRTIQGTSVTIHWNFNTAHIADGHVYPFVRIGVLRPDNTAAMLFEDYVLAFPTIKDAGQAIAPQPMYLNKNTPLLVLADYLCTHHKRESLVNILENIQSGRHYYFTYLVTDDAPLGKYRIISEVYNNGKIKYSTTSPDDFFLVEKVSVNNNSITNHSNEKAPVKIVHYKRETTLTEKDIRVFEMMPKESIPTDSFPAESFLLYNEERVIIPLQQRNSVRCIRNPRALPLEKDHKLYIMLNSGEAFTLEQEERNIWDKADGIITKSELCHSANEHIYREMALNQLIIELNK